MQTYQYGLKKRNRADSDQIMKFVLLAIASVAVLIVFLIIVFILGNSWGAIEEVGIIHFLFGNDWNISNETFGAINIILGSILVTIGAIAFALPIGLGAAIYISEIASPKMRNILKPVCEVFAGIPSVVYGFFGVLVLLPILKDIFENQLVFNESWLAGSILLGIMALPTVISVSEDAIHSVPHSYREASLAMGATRWETTIKVIVPAAISGISAAAILGIGRAIGETMAVMMVTGNNPAMFPDPIWNIFSLISTITGVLAAQIPDSATDSLLYQSLFLLAVVLLVMVLVINFASRYIIKSMNRKLGNADPHDSIIYKLTGREKLLNGAVDDFLADKKELIIEVVVYVCIFVFVWMMSTLFTGDVASIIVAAVVCVLVFAIRKLMNTVNSTTVQQIAHGSLTVVMGFVVLILVFIIGYILINGIPAIDKDFITGTPTAGGMGGGILPMIVGTLELIAGTALIALPLGILTGVYLAEYAKNSLPTRIIREAIDLLNGTPSIVFGLFGMAFIVKALGIGVSMVAGWFVLAFMIMPVIIRTTEEALRSVPPELREASQAMGASKWKTTYKVVIPAAMGGVLTGTILSLGRAAGETAPIMFTAAVSTSSTLFADTIFEPVLALPYHLYFLATQNGPVEMQYGTATILLLIVLSMFLLASVIRSHYNKKVKW